MNYNLISFFSGGGGLDLGFHKAGFNTIYANEYDKQIAKSYKNYFKDVFLDTRSISKIKKEDLPFCDGIIGGPPCQSWSVAGSKRGADDPRGKLFFDYINIIDHLKPKFFLAENVPGILSPKNRQSFDDIISKFNQAGYDVFWQKMNASDYGVAQDRQRVIIVGFLKSLHIKFNFPDPIKPKKTLKDVIFDLKDLSFDSEFNHEISNTGFSPMFLSRNRVRNWNEASFTILASDRHIPIHPQAPKMVSTGHKDKMSFVKGSEHLYRRLTVRECARIQGFPDDYNFIYNHPRIGYKIIGNAVPIELAYQVAKKIKEFL